MKKIIVILFMCSSVVNAQTFVVSSGQTRTLTNSIVSYEKFIMEDNSTLIIKGLKT